MGKNKQKSFPDPSLAGIPLPPKVKCNRCEKNLPQARFSANQLNTAKAAIKNRGKGATYSIKCMSCSGGQLVEIECSMCGHTKGLDDFSKVQRTKPDQAKCYACVEKQLDQTPVAELNYEDPTKAHMTADDSEGRQPYYWDTSTNQSNASDAGEDYGGDSEGGGISLSTDLASMSMSSNKSNHLIDPSEMEPDFSIKEGTSNTSKSTDDGHEWQVAGRKSSRSKSTGQSFLSGFNPNKYGNPTASQSNSTYGTGNTFDSNYTERSDGPRTKTGWAKIKAFEPQKQVVENDWSSEEERDGDQEDDSDDDDVEI